MSQHQYLLDRYAQSLTKYDVQELFERLKEKLGNVTAATREVDIQRKTVYDWETSSEDVKASTKRKILEASLNNDVYGTMEFLVRKNAMNYHEILERYISTSCDEIVSLNELHEFQTRITGFEKFMKSHIGAIHDIKTIPIEEMIASINQKSNSLGVEGISEDVNLISPWRLSQKFIHLLETFNTATMFKQEMADRLDLPKEFITRACEAISYMDPPTQPSGRVMGLGERKVSRLSVEEVDLVTLPYMHHLNARKE